MPLVTLDRVSMAYGHLPLLDQASFRIEPRERVCVIGRNGTGKSTLLQIVGGDLHLRRASSGTSRVCGSADWRRMRCLPTTVGSSTSWPKGLAHRGESWQAEQRVAKVLSRLQIPADVSMRRSRVDGGGACCWRERWWREPDLLCSTSRPIISTSRRCAGSKDFSPTTQARCCS